MDTYIKGKFLLLGTNLGDRSANIDGAIRHLEDAGIKIIEKSSVYESEPWGISEQPWFFNQVVRVETDLSPEKLLEKILEIELKMGRVRKIKWGERLIDIDILFYDDRHIDLNEPGLKVPHPEIQNRKFTLEPLSELVPDQFHPTLRKSIRELNEKCTDPLTCRRIKI